jgi:hypothetical protein
MNDAESTPSPNRFWRKFGIRKAALNASAALERPRAWDSTRWRTRPATRLSRMPDATRVAAPRTGVFRAMAGAAAEAVLHPPRAAAA